MNADLAAVLAVIGAAVAGVSAGLALWKSLQMRTAFLREVESAFRRSREGASAQPTFDVFMSYVSDSKEFAEQLTDALESHGVRVWFDQDQINVGDNVFAKLGEGLSASRYGLVILSPHFFEREWADRELNALLKREDENKSLVLPVWHGVTQDEVQRFAPELAVKRALRSDAESVEQIASDVARIARPEPDHPAYG